MTTFDAPRRSFTLLCRRLPTPLFASERKGAVIHELNEDKACSVGQDWSQKHRRKRNLEVAAKSTLTHTSYRKRDKHKTKWRKAIDFASALTHHTVTHSDTQ